jgi:Zn-finger nucleic acid-binding protein
VIPNAALQIGGSLICPRCHVDLKPEHHSGIQVDKCPDCSGRWLDFHELGALEQTVDDDPQRWAGMIEYLRTESGLLCPMCRQQMRAFDYRAYRLELDTCTSGHGYWLDPGEDRGVKDAVEDRIRALERAHDAEVAWGAFLYRLRHPTLWDKIRDLMGL